MAQRNRTKGQFKSRFPTAGLALIVSVGVGTMQTYLNTGPREPSEVEGASQTGAIACAVYDLLVQIH
ncbi:hypothetical protein A5669_21865 [Mycolicibacterium fortuitum]|nr:hypothetical protein A5669_21865 [Mycolicibacterium fortuitum]